MAKNSEKLKLRGFAVYPKTDRPYRYDQSAGRSVVDYDNGRYELNVALSAEQAEGFQKIIKAVAKEGGLKTVKNWPWKPEVDKDTGDETGRILFVAKQNAMSKDGTPKKISHYDASAERLPATFKLTTGSEVIMACRPGVYKTLGGGVTLYLDAVQVLNYVEYQGGENPFGKEDGSFVKSDDESEDEIIEENNEEENADF